MALYQSGENNNAMLDIFVTKLAIEEFEARLVVRIEVDAYQPHFQ